MPSRMPNEGILEILPLSDPGFLVHGYYHCVTSWSNSGLILSGDNSVHRFVGVRKLFFVSTHKNAPLLQSIGFVGVLKL